MVFYVPKKGERNLAPVKEQGWTCAVDGPRGKWRISGGTRFNSGTNLFSQDHRANIIIYSKSSHAFGSDGRARNSRGHRRPRSAVPTISYCWRCICAKKQQKVTCVSCIFLFYIFYFPEQHLNRALTKLNTFRLYQLSH